MVNVSMKETSVSLDHCHRCGGMMVPELALETNSVERRCIICGERVDPVILEHRRQRTARTEAETGGSAFGAAALN